MTGSGKKHYLQLQAALQQFCVEREHTFNFSSSIDQKRYNISLTIIRQRDSQYPLAVSYHINGNGVNISSTYYLSQGNFRAVLEGLRDSVSLQHNGLGLILRYKMQASHLDDFIDFVVYKVAEEVIPGAKDF